MLTKKYCKNGVYEGLLRSCFVNTCKRKHSIDREFQSFSCAKKETINIDKLIASRNGDRKIIQYIRITSSLP